MGKIKVLVVDDSLVFREVLARGLSSDPQIEIVAKAMDPFEARDKILKFRPDVMTCDIEMPKMNGIEFVRRLIPQYPLSVIVVSSVSSAVFEAMNAGAVDFAAKPDVRSPESVENFIEDLISKIKIAVMAKVPDKAGIVTAEALGNQPSLDTNLQKHKIIAIGASTGGTEAIFNLLRALPPQIPGIVIAQHIPPIFSKMFADRLNGSTRLQVREAVNGDFVNQGFVLIAPGGKQMRVKKVGERYKVECFEGDKVNGHCPSVDLLFDSVAKEARDKAIGIILTGMGYDGAKGLLSMRRRGARTIGQDEKSSVVYGMPKVAFELGAIEKQAALSDIPFVLNSMLKVR